jgi:hypothetical protein
VSSSLVTPGDGAVFSGGKPASKSLGPFAEHAEECLFLSIIELPLQSIQHFGFVDQELGFDSDTGKPHQPVGDLVLLVRRFEHLIVILAASKNRGRQCRESRLTEALRQSFLGDGSVRNSVCSGLTPSPRGSK